MGTDLALYKDGMYIATLGRTYNYDKVECIDDLANYMFYNLPFDKEDRKGFIEDMLYQAWGIGASDTVALMKEQGVTTKGA